MEFTIIKLYSNVNNEIENFLNHYYSNNNTRNSIENIGEYNSSRLEWQKKYQNPIEMVDMIGTFIENNDKYKINMWISIDQNCYINVTDNNADEIIRYLFERYPW